jgi:hypothetical protein
MHQEAGPLCCCSACLAGARQPAAGSTHRVCFWERHERRARVADVGRQTGRDGAGRTCAGCGLCLRVFVE